MQIVIDISEADYWKIKENFADLQVYLKEKAMDNFSNLGLKMQNAVYHGTPLPKGHGRLIDADELEECKEIMTTISGESKYVVRMDDIRNMPTIIEADTESEDEE